KMTVKYSPARFWMERIGLTLFQGVSLASLEYSCATVRPTQLGTRIDRSTKPLATAALSSLLLATFSLGLEGSPTFNRFEREFSCGSEVCYELGLSGDTPTPSERDSSFLREVSLRQP